MEWALEQAVKHPKLENAFVNANGDWLDVLLPDGRAFRFRPGAMIKSDATEEQREVLLNRLIDVGVEQAEESRVEEAADSDASSAEPPAAEGTANDADTSADDEPTDSYMPADADWDAAKKDAPVVPIVRAADYFLPSHRNSDSMVYLPLTDFLAVGIAHDLPDTIEPIYYTQLEDDSRDLGELMSEAVMTLRLMTNKKQQSVELEISEIAGALVMTFSQPVNYELSWFADLDMIQQVAERIAQERPDDIPLFVPASRTKLYVVFSDDPHLADFFTLLLAQRDSADAVYPLPHTVAADGWLEWQPFPGSKLAEVLGALRNHFRENVYGSQVRVMEKWDAMGALKPFVSRRLKTGERVSTTEWDASDRHGSVPVTDFITFTREASPHPWEDVPPVNITVRTRVAAELWPQGFTQDDNAWPPRYTIDGFPDDETLVKLRDATDRRF